MKQTVKRLAATLREMVDNYHELGKAYRNIPLAEQCLDIFRQLPDAIEDEYKSSEEKADLIENMLGVMDEYLTPRLCIRIREYIRQIVPQSKSNEASLQRLNDYINPDLTNEEWQRRYHRRSLKFDPVERTPEYEACIYEVEKACDDSLSDFPRGMGFCHAYWPAKAAELLKHGIRWKSPHMMNPRVLFD